MKPQGPAAESVECIFYQANFIRDLNIRLDKVSEGTCETSLVVQERLRQQHGFVHGGVIATMADHTAGGAARFGFRRQRRADGGVQDQLSAPGHR